MGRCAAGRIESGRDGALIDCRSRSVVAVLGSSTESINRRAPYYYRGDGDGFAPAAGFTSSNSTSKMRVEFGPISGPTARSP